MLEANWKRPLDISSDITLACNIKGSYDASFRMSTRYLAVWTVTKSCLKIWIRQSLKLIEVQ